MSTPSQSTRDSGRLHPLQPGSVVQITDETPGRDGWLGAFVLVTEVKSWGVQGFVHMIKSHDEKAEAYIRVPHGNYEYIGEACFVPASVADELLLRQGNTSTENVK